MHTPIISSKQAKQARIELGLSQGKVSTDLGINRSYLSQFESGKYLFSDNDLNKIKTYYSENGFEFPELAVELDGEFPDIDSEPPCRVIDGFVVPDHMFEDTVEELLSEYAENKAEIDGIASEPVKSGLIFSIDHEHCESRFMRVIELMARNYTLIESIQGHAVLLPCSPEDAEENPASMGEYIGQRLNEIFGYQEMVV